jgi:type IX secretion system PorP/SprF family membrane protein
MTKNILFAVLFTFLGTALTQAQEAGVYTHYHLNPVLLNPGATGFDADHTFLASYRNRWAAFDGSPKTFTFMYHGQVADRMGIGGQLFAERIGEYRSFQAQASYAYQFDVDMFHVGIGLSTGFQQLRLSSVSDDPLIDQTDEVLNEALDGVTLFDASFGIYGEHADGLLFGVSFPNLVRSRLADITGDIEDPNEEFNYAVLLGYRIEIPNHDFTVEPSIAVKNIRRVPFHVDLNLVMTFLDEQLTGGITYSVGEESGFGVLIGTRVDRLQFAYSYDVSFGDLQKHNNGSHELTISYRLPVQRDMGAESGN